MGFTDDSWWERGNCRHADPRIFDGRTNSGPRHRDWSAARRLCAGCPVRGECLQYVLSMPRDGGSDDAYAAGHTPRELDEMRARRGTRHVPVNTPSHDPARWQR